MAKIWGKLIGGLLGLATGGPVGALLGAAIGHAHDVGQDMGSPSFGTVFDGLSGYVANASANAEQAVFTMGVIVLGAKMAKADGGVTRAEIDAFKRVFQIAPEQEAGVGLLFDRARQSADGFEPYAFRLAAMFHNNPVLLEQILGGLFIIAAADNAGLSPAEINFLERVGVIFGFDHDNFARVAARAGVHLPGAGAGNGESASSSFVYEEDHYTILGVSRDASFETIKSAYRALIREHHPDRLVAQGMPPEFVAAATEKMKRINGAYDAICKAKGMK